MRRTITINWAGILLAAVLFALVWYLVFSSLGHLADTSKKSGLQQVRAAVEQAMMHCYALEGAYPPDLAYLTEHYGLILDTSRYLFLYEVVGDNVPPIIDVQLLEDVQS